MGLYRWEADENRMLTPTESVLRLELSGKTIPCVGMPILINIDCYLTVSESRRIRQHRIST
jgi:hypothetical protein